MRWLVTMPSSPISGEMSIAFLIGTPVAVGAIAVYGSPKARTSLLYSLVAPIVPMALMLLGCAITLLEGSICIAIMAPFFLALAAFGGFIMALALRIRLIGRPTLGLLGVSPFLLIPLDNLPMPDTVHELRESIVIHAEPHVVWQQIMTAKDIREDELPLSVVHLIGVPKPIDAENRTSEFGETRFSQWEKGVHFTAAVVEKQDFQSITWRYSFGPDSFPPGSMDEHVVIGGKYLDLGNTTFTLQAIDGGNTRLEIVGRYRLTTPINGYAVPVSRFLGKDFLRMLLGFYKGRAERSNAIGST
ncbi:MAG: hypothetical protein JNM52_10780 [Betaproteobacteria bacterium]|nr:hypothetical protein [Betaproteobacteria bacterium]